MRKAEFHADVFWEIAQDALDAGADRDSVIAALMVTIARLETPQTAGGEVPPVAGSDPPATIIATPGPPARPDASPRAPHWTDDVPSPVFSSVIVTDGPRGNIFSILGAAVTMMRELDVPGDRVLTLSQRVASARSYDEAVAAIERWFLVNREK